MLDVTSILKRNNFKEVINNNTRIVFMKNGSEITLYKSSRMLEINNNFYALFTDELTDLIQNI